MTVHRRQSVGTVVGVSRLVLAQRMSFHYHFACCCRRRRHFLDSSLDCWHSPLLSVVWVCSFWTMKKNGHWNDYSMSTTFRATQIRTISDQDYERNWTVGVVVVVVVDAVVVDDKAMIVAAE